MLEPHTNPFASVMKCGMHLISSLQMILLELKSIMVECAGELWNRQCGFRNWKEITGAIIEVTNAILEVLKLSDLRRKICTAIEIMLEPKCVELYKKKAAVFRPTVRKV